MSECIFCQIIAGQIPATRVFEDDRVLAFMDINPINDGHLLVIPKTHAPTIYDISPDELTAVMAAGKSLAHALKKALDPAGLNLHQSNGRVANQIVDHFHLHLIPRWPDDEFSKTMKWPLTAGDPEVINRTAEKIRAAL